MTRMKKLIALALFALILIPAAALGLSGCGSSGEIDTTGMTIDEEGMLWIAHWDGWRVSRWDPETGTKLSEIMLPVRQVTCPCFGGPDYGDLYITTASIGLSEQDRKEQPLAGATFVVRPGVKGCRANKFICL